MARVSVIVPAYNREKYLRRCIGSILNQTFTDFELVIVDDCSTDNSFEIYGDYGSRDPRVKIIRNGENLGASLARKVGLDGSSGKYISFVDSDDYVGPDFLRDMHDVIVKGHDYVRTDFNMYRMGNTEYTYIRYPGFTNDFYDDFENITRGFCTLCNSLVTRELYDRVRFPEFGYVEDLVITTQLRIKAENKIHIETSSYYNTFNEDSIFKGRMTWEKLQEIVNNLYGLVEILGDNGKDLSRCIKPIKLLIKGYFERFLKECDMTGADGDSCRWDFVPVGKG